MWGNHVIGEYGRSSSHSLSDGERRPSSGAYSQSALKGRMKRYELAIVKSAFKLIFQYVKRSSIRLSADRGFPDDDLFALLDELKID